MSTVKAVVYRLFLLILAGSLYLMMNIDRNTKGMGTTYTKASSDQPYFKLTNIKISKENNPDPTVKEKPVIRRFIKQNTSGTRNQHNNSTKTTATKEYSKQAQNGTGNIVGRSRSYQVHWFNPPHFLKFRRKAYTASFSGCEYSNCRLTYDRKQAIDSDAIVFDGRWVPETLNFARPRGQAWIFAAHESPQTYDDRGNWWTKPQWVSSFNWTMTYNRDIADIYLPYGEIRRTTDHVNRNFTEIALNKKKTALAIISHCTTSSKREMYIKKLQRYIDIDILGACGKAWKCGERYLHDGCFQILNTTYKFFLSFENAMCGDYFTEKLFENYNYDILLVVRGGRTRDSERHLVNGTYIPADGYKTVRELGQYLRNLAWSLDDYATFLQTKSEYKVEGFDVVYKRALCDICKRLNHQGIYKKRIGNIKELIYSHAKCRRPTSA